MESGGTDIFDAMFGVSGLDVFTHPLGAEQSGLGAVLEDRETTILTSEQKTRLKVFAAGSGDAKLRGEMEALMSVNRLALDYFAQLLRGKTEEPGAPGSDAQLGSD